MINEVEAKSPYISLEFCFYNQNFEKIDINRRGLGITGDIINYSMVSISAGSTELLESYMKNQGIDKNIAKFYKSKVVGNFGLYSYLFKKVEGKDNERAIQEVVFESVATELGSVATKTATRFGITMAGRILGGVAGSVIPSVGTIIGAVVGAWIAGKIEEWWFNENSLESSQIDNEKLTRLEQAYFTKINTINDYFTKNNYKELRILNESEAENLCKEVSNLQSHYFKTIELMLSYKDYLSNQQVDSSNTESTPTQSNTTPTTKESKANTESTDSKTQSNKQAKDSNNSTTPKNNNPNTQSPNTFPFSLQIKDYNTFTPLSNKQIQLTNIDSKQIYTQTTDSRGYVSFEIKESERGDFFSVKLLNDNEYEPTPYYLTKQPQQPKLTSSHQIHNHTTTQSPNNNTQTYTTPQSHSPLSNNNSQQPKHTIQKILNPNSYTNHPAILYFKAQTSLYFNGTTLCIMQGTKNLASFNARSGKAITQEEKLELEQQGYEGFVSSFTDELIQTLQHSKAKDPAIIQNSTLQASCYHCYDKRYQETGQCIQDGVYYLNTSQVEYLKQLIHKLESQKIKAYEDTLRSQENQISKEEKESYTQEPHTTQYNDMHLTLYKDKECREECAMIRVYQAGSVDSSNVSMIQMQYDKFKEFIQKQMSLNYPATQPYTILQVEMANSITSIRILNHNASVFASIAKPFAPGTYIELEAVGENIENSIYWQMELRAWKRDKILQKPYIVYGGINQTQERTKGVYLSSPNKIDRLRQQGYDRFIYIIRASTAQSFVNAAQLVFNLSFEVGVGSDEKVREGEYKSNDTTFAIATLSQAIEYLRMTYVHYKEQQDAGQIHSLGQYFSKYPRIAGKIAYIYYRFDMGDEAFINSIKQDNERYKNDRDKYIQISKNMLLYGYLDSKKSIKIIDEYKRLISKKDVKLNKDFIEKLIKKVCGEFKLSLQPVCDENQQCSIIGFYKKNTGSYGSYDVDSNTIHINENNLRNLKEIIATAFHEVRHFYINTYFNPHKYADLSVLKQYLYQSDQLYIESAVVKGTNIFKKFTKRCLNNDADNVDCIPDDNQNAYEIQPNERDPRYVAYQIIKVL